ncbi:MAG: TetR/AcrR family transcriptional regulator [Opitutaceae bacterium]
MSRNGQINHRSSERKLQQILRGAARVFCEKGFEGASVRDISRATGVSLSGLYYYFKSKQELLYLIQHHTFTSVFSQLEKRLAGVQDPSERLRTLIRNHLDYFMSHPVEMKVLSHEDEALEAPYRKEVVALKRRYYEIARTIFEGLRRQGVARPMNPRVAVLTLFGMMNWVYTWHKSELDPGAASLAETITEIFLSGIATESRRDGVPELAKRRRIAPGLPSQAREIAR